MAALRLVNEHAPLEHVLEALELGGAELQHRLLHRATKQRMHVPSGGALALFAALFATLLRIAAQHMITTRGARPRRRHAGAPLGLGVSERNRGRADTEALDRAVKRKIVTLLCENDGLP